MTAINPVTMIFFAVSIAIVYGDNSCNITPCKCSFSNIEVISNYIEEKINATVSTIVAEVTSTMSGALNVMVKEKVDSLRAEISGTVSALNATVDDRIRTVNTSVGERITTVNATVGALDVSVAKLLSQPGKFVN